VLIGGFLKMEHSFVDNNKNRPDFFGRFLLKQAE
jgi:hypothetical protein